jgi:TorA maturation chaperone TorD
MNKKDFTDIEKARATVFNMFTALLCQPEEGLLKTPNVFDTLERALKVVLPESSGHVGQIRETLKQSAVQDLLVEYTRLFIGPFKTLAPPYSSLYFGHDTLMSDKTMWVVNCYKKSGFVFNGRIQDVPDHVTIETEFLYCLLHNEIRALDSGDGDGARRLWENQKEFFDGHYRKWVPAFCERVASETNNEYFRVLSKCLQEFIRGVGIPGFPVQTATA